MKKPIIHKTREIISLARNNGKTYAEISRVIGISPALVQHIETNPDYIPGRRIRNILCRHIPQEWDIIQDLTVAELTHVLVNRETY